MPCRARQAQPNAAHMALAMFSVDSMRHAIAPDSTFALITQNVDGLSVRAWDAAAAAADPPLPDSDRNPVLLEMHGRLFEVVCTNKMCQDRRLDLSSPISPALGGTEDTMEKGKVEADIPESALPRCVECGSLTRPGVVWFGETPHYMDKIDDLVAQADLCLVVGTSSTVSIR